MLLDAVPTSRDWAENIALTVLSTVCGRITLDTKIAPLPLNIWSLMIGPSGLAYKSTPLNYYVYPTLAEITELIDKPIIMPSKFSVEGMIEYLSKREQGRYVHNEGCIVRDEFTTLFKESRNKQYQADIMEFLSELYDCTVQKRYTRKAKLEEVSKVYITLLAATTPYLFDIMERDFFIQGTGNRILYTIFEPKRPKRLDPDDFFVTREREMERERRLSEFAGRLARVYLSNLRCVFPMDEAKQLWCDWQYKLNSEALKRYHRNRMDVIYTYVQRVPTYALKLAALSAISRSYVTIPKLRGDTIMCMEQDMEWAIAKAERHIKHFYALLEAWEVMPEESKPEVHERELRRLLRFIKNSPDKMLTQRELLKLSGMVKSNRFYELISTLVSRGEIEVLTDAEVVALPESVKKRHGIKLGAGRPPNVYRLAGAGPESDEIGGINWFEEKK